MLSMPVFSKSTTTPCGWIVKIIPDPAPALIRLLVAITTARGLPTPLLVGYFRGVLVEILAAGTMPGLLIVSQLPTLIDGQLVSGDPLYRSPFGGETNRYTTQVKNTAIKHPITGENFPFVFDPKNP